MFATEVTRLNEQQFNETAERLTKVNEVIAKLEPEIQAEAFSILKPYVVSEAGVDEADAEVGETGEVEHREPRDGPVD